MCKSEQNQKKTLLARRAAGTHFFLFKVYCSICADGQCIVEKMCAASVLKIIGDFGGLGPESRLALSSHEIEYETCEG